MKERLDFNKPARAIPTNYRNITGRIFSKKSNRLIGFESKLERDFIYIFEFSDQIEKILEQPITILYELEGKKRRYTPDFFVLCKNGDEYLVEIKYRNDLYENFNELKYKFKAAIKFSNENNCSFKIMTNLCSLMNNKEYMFNVHFLLSYDTITIQMYESIKSKIVKSSPIEDLLNSLSNDRYRQLEIINHIWTLVRYKIIKLNLLKKLTNKSKIIDFKSLNKDEFKKIF